MFLMSSLPIKGIRSCGIEALSNLAPHLGAGFGVALGFIFFGTKLSSTTSLVKHGLP